MRNEKEKYQNKLLRDGVTERVEEDYVKGNKEYHHKGRQIQGLIY